MNYEAFQRLNYGIFIVGVAFDGKDYGCLVNSFAQVTSGARPRFTLTLNKKNATYLALHTQKSVAVSVVPRNASGELLHLFGFESSRHTDKFSCYESARDDNGNPYLTGANAVVSLRVVQEVDLGSYRRYGPSSTDTKVSQELDLNSYALFVLDAEDARTLHDVPALTLADYNADGGDIPDGITAYRTPVRAHGYVCRLCGYLHRSDNLPNEFLCPVCGAGSAVFDKK